jgi:hypothetical protein
MAFGNTASVSFGPGAGEGTVAGEESLNAAVAVILIAGTAPAVASLPAGPRCREDLDPWCANPPHPTNRSRRGTRRSRARRRTDHG